MSTSAPVPMTSPARRLTVLDGGMGRELLRIGAPFRQPEWSALALYEGPEWVVRAHSNFVDAGAEVITTNSYAIVPFHIGEARFVADAERLAELSGVLARRAAGGADRGVGGIGAAKRVRVAASLPPLFGSYEPDRFDPDDASRVIDPLVRGLSPHADLWLGETLGSIVEARTVAAALARHDPDDRRPLWISYALADVRPATLASGESVGAAVRVAVELGASGVLFNCSTAASIADAIAVAASIAPADVEIGGYANRFVSAPTTSGAANEGLSELRTDLDPHAYCEVAREWRELGASIIGGCCGMTPDHIAAIASLADAPSTRAGA